MCFFYVCEVSVFVGVRKTDTVNFLLNFFLSPFLLFLFILKMLFYYFVVAILWELLLADLSVYAHTRVCACMLALVMMVSIDSVDVK